MACVHLKNGICRIVKSKTGIEWITDPRTCDACLNQIPSHRWNKVTIGLCLVALRTAKKPKYAHKITALVTELHRQQVKNGKPASLSRRVTNYAKAIARWTAAGQPKRTDEEVASILMICRACSYFNGKSCKVCGCRVSASQAGLTNKARMATELCPKKKW